MQRTGISKPSIATIQQVAEKAGVSTATVSHVINETKKVQADTRQRVQAAIEALNYTQNPAARNLARGRVDIWGLLISDLRNPFFPELAAAFQREALGHNLDALIMNTDWDEGRTLACVKRLLNLRVPAIALMTSLVDESVMEMLADNRICTAYLDLGRVGPYVSNIAVNYEQGVSEAIAHLVGLGHRRIGFISGSGKVSWKVSSVERRQSAFLSFAHADGSLETMTMDSDFTLRGGYVACSKLLTRFSPTAIFAVNDLAAVGALQCASDRGVRVPGDLSIVGFDDIPLAEFAQPALTTVNIRREMIGQLAFQALWEMLNNQHNEGKEYAVGPALVIRESTAKPHPAGKSPSDSPAVAAGTRSVVRADDTSF